MTRTRRPPHPGRTPAQRRVLDAIGCVNPCPTMSPATRKAPIAAGSIEQHDSHTIGHDRLGPITVPLFEMPVAVHIAWCAAVALDDAETDEFERENAAKTAEAINRTPKRHVHEDFAVAALTELAEAGRALLIETGKPDADAPTPR